LRKVALVIIIALAASLGLSALPALPTESNEIDPGSVSIVKGSTINLVSRQSSFPVPVTNTYPGEVRVIVKLQSSSGKVVVEKSAVQLVIPAGTTITAQFPIRAIGSGDVVMVAWLTTISGLELGERVSIKLLASPDIETTAIVLFLSFVAILLTVGTSRTLRRRKTS
jgi:hypothetical protein